MNVNKIEIKIASRMYVHNEQRKKNDNRLKSLPIPRYDEKMREKKQTAKFQVFEYQQ